MGRGCVDLETEVTVGQKLKKDNNSIARIHYVRVADERGVLEQHPGLYDSHPGSDFLLLSGSKPEHLFQLKFLVIRQNN